MTNTPSSIQQAVIQWYGISNLEFGMLYSIYNLPNIALSLLTGLLIDRIGIRQGTLLFMSLILLGQIIFVLATYYSNYSLALAGRFLLG